MKPLLVIFSYSGQDEMLNRHWPYFEKAECDILLSSPVDAACERGGLTYAKSQHYGSQLMARTFWTFRHVLKLGFDAYYFVEGDSVCLRPAPRKLTDGLHCFLWDNHDPRFTANQYPHWVLGMNRKTLVALESASRNYDPALESGFPDRLIGRICEESNIPMIHSPKLCHSRNRISDNPEHEKEARQALKDGIVFLHGIKTQQDLWNLGL